MARWNEKRRLLEDDAPPDLALADVKAPSLYRGLFPYTEVPRITFGHAVVPPEPPEDIFITDTTFRDGQQARPPYTVRQIADIFEFLHRLSGPKGVIRQSEFFLYSERDRAALEACREKGHRFPEITGWVRAVEADLALVAEAGLPETGVLTSVSDYHIFLKLGLTRKKAMEKYLAIVRRAIELGIRPRCHFEDVTRSDVHGFCVPFARALMRLREESGVDVKIRLCDTMGYGVPYAGAALPRSVPALVRAFIDDAGVPGSLLEWHGHNDFHKALVNTSAAWLAGCAGANGTLLGFGERTGNAPLEGLLIEYMALTGDSEGLDATAINDAADYFARELGYRIPPNYPFAGAEFNATAAGIHADGLVKDEEIYNIFDTRKILGRPPGIIITDKSGIAGIAYWVNNRLRLDGDRRLDKRHPGIARIHKRVMREYAEGRATSISSEELERWARRYLPEHFVSEFERLKRHAAALAEHMVAELLEEESVRSMTPARQEPVLEALIEFNPFIQYACVVDKDGRKVVKNIVAAADLPRFSAAGPGEDLSDREWYREPLRKGAVHVTDFYTSRYTGALCITVSGPIRDEMGDILGVLAIDIRFEDLVKMEENLER